MSMSQSIKAPAKTLRRPAAAERAQGKKEAPPAILETSSRMKRLTLDIPEELHRVIKRNAADEGITMAEKLRGVLMEYYRVAA
jgi:predicted DNA binding CopG/RHH family protein